MASPDAAFAGSIPAVYERELVPMLFAPYAEEAARRLSDLTAGAVLETAAGTGVVTAALARSLPGAVGITATDLNAGMVSVARGRPGTERVTWQVADALALPFADASFDALVCAFGVMFFPDRDAGHAEAARVLRSRGRLLLTVWDSLEHNGVTRVVHEAVAAAFPDDPPDFVPRVPFGYTDRGEITRQLTAAGFSSVDIEPLSLPCQAESAASAATGICQGTPLRMQIEARGGDIGDVTAQAAAALEEEYGAGPLRAEMRALVITAVR